MLVLYRHIDTTFLTPPLKIFLNQNIVWAPNSFWRKEKFIPKIFYPKNIFSIKYFGQVRIGQDGSGQDRIGQDRTGPNRRGQDETGKVETDQDKLGQYRT